MTYCNCGCAQRVHDLEATVRDMRYELDAFKRDLEREVDDRRDAVRQVANDLSDVYAGRD